MDSRLSQRTDGLKCARSGCQESAFGNPGRRAYCTVSASYSFPRNEGRTRVIVRVYWGCPRPGMQKVAETNDEEEQNAEQVEIDECDASRRQIQDGREVKTTCQTTQLIVTYP